MNIAVIFAGGIGVRMKSKEKPKQFLALYNKPVIIRTIEHFEHHPQIDAIVVACVDGWIDHLKDLISQYQITKVCSVVPGGKTGQLSIYNGLCEAEKIADGDDAIVLIHDGVRPLIDRDVITANIENTKKFGSAITCGTVKETILLVDEDTNMIKNVPSRKSSRVAKAPQSFYLKDILDAQRKSIARGETDWIDSCTLMANEGYTLHLIDGNDDNIKITTPDDFYTARALIDAKDAAQMFEE